MKDNELQVFVCDQSVVVPVPFQRPPHPVTLKNYPNADPFESERKHLIIIAGQ